MNPLPSVLVTAARTRAAYAIVRSLALQGVPVYVADSTPRSMAFLSRYVRGHFVYPSPFATPKAFIDRLNRIGADHGIDVLMPVMEETYTIARYQDSLSPTYKTATMDYPSLIQMHDKSRWAPLADALGVRVPSTTPLLDVLADSKALGRVRFPALVKPMQGGGGWGIREAASVDALPTVVEAMKNAGEEPAQFYLQERVEGETVCVAMLYQSGRAVATIAYRQLRNFPRPFGQATLRKTVSCPAAEESLRKLLDRLSWTGVCEADFVVQRGTGIPYLIDVNPRFWGSVALAVFAGLDFPFLSYQIALGRPVPEQAPAPAGVCCRWLGGDLAAIASDLRSRAGRQNLGAVRRQSPRVRYFDDFDTRDPLPFLGWCADALMNAVSERVRHATTRDALHGVWD